MLNVGLVHELPMSFLGLGIGNCEHRRGKGQIGCILPTEVGNFQEGDASVGNHGDGYEKEVG